MTTITRAPTKAVTFTATIRDMPRRPPGCRTLGELAYLNLRDTLGPVRAATTAARIGSCLLAMAQTAEKIGHWPTRAEYAQDWRMSERQVTRDWGSVEAGLGVRPNDQHLADWVLGRRLEGTTNSKQLEAEEAPSWLSLAA